MKAIITCGHPYSGFDDVFEQMTSAGLVPAHASRREKMDVASLHEKILQAHDIPPNAPAPQTQLEPGKIWQELAVDLFLGNLDHPQWGWADPRSAWLLEFWKEMDQQVRFILVYATPQDTLANMMHAPECTAQEVLQRLQGYHAYNACLLHFFMRNPGRCLLVQQQAAQQPGALLQHIQAQWGVTLSTPSTQAMLAHAGGTDELHAPAVARLVARQLLDRHPQLHALYDELQSVATLPAPGTAAQEAAAPENNAHALLLTDYMALYRRKAQSDDQPPVAEETPLAQAPAHTDSQYAEIEEENELLLLQLHQVQEELENYYLKYQEASQQLQAQRHPHAGQAPAVPLAQTYWLRHHPAEVLIDLRETVPGSNWHEPELDGTWAGPGLSSTVELPALRQGKYDLLIDVVDAMDASLVEGLQASLAGQPLDLKKEIHDKAALLRARLDSSQFPSAHEWTLQLDCPAVISPADRGVPDNRHLSVRIKTIKLKAVN